MKLVGLDGCRAAFLGRTLVATCGIVLFVCAGGAFFACGSLGILRCERDGRFQGGQSHATEDPLVGGGLPRDRRE